MARTKSSASWLQTARSVKPGDERQHLGFRLIIGYKFVKAALMFGVALWLTVVYHETKDSHFAEQQELHRQVMRSLRTLKEAIPASELNRWMINEAEAA